MKKGLTAVEVLVALVFISLAMSILTGAIVGSVKNDRSSGQRTQAGQILNAIGRQVVAGKDGIIPVVPTTKITWAYGNLSSSFPELVGKSGLGDMKLYRASVTRDAAALSLAGISVTQYDISVCWKEGADEKCLDGVTAGPDTPTNFIGN